MSEQTDTWRPDAEPWEALAEALARTETGSSQDHVGEARRLVMGLAWLGWRLCPVRDGVGPDVSPVKPEGDYREYVSAYGDLTLRVWLDGTVEVFDDEATVDRWEGVTALSPSPEQVLVDRADLETILRYVFSGKVEGEETARAYIRLKDTLDGLVPNVDLVPGDRP